MPAALLFTILLLFVPALQQQDEVTSRFNRAMELQRQGAWKEAAEEYRALLAITPNYPEAQANFGAVLSRLGHYEEAISAYETALRLNPKLTPILLNLGIAHYRAGQFEKSVETLERFLAVAPGHLQARRLIGISLVELGRDQAAISYLEPTLSDSADEAAVLYSLGTAYQRLGRPELSSIIERLAARTDGVALARLLEGQEHLEMLRFEKAATALESAAKLSPDLPRLQFLLGLAYFKLGRTESAKACFERELDRTPSDFLTLYYLASLLEKEGDLSAARRHLETALKLEAPTAEGIEAGRLLGSILLKQGQAAEAVRVLENVLAQAPNNSQIRFLLARSYQKLGRRQEAAREFNEVERLKAQELEREKERKPDQ